MTIQSPLVLASGFFSQLFPGDTVPGTDTTAQASGNAALVLAGTALASGNAGISTGLTALASGNAGISTGLTALASGNAGISTGLTALASGNAGLVSASNKVPISGGTMTGVLAVTSGTAALPGITFTGDPNTGLFSPGADQVAISTGGTSRLAVSTTAVSSTLAVDIPLGAVGTPSLTFTGDLNTGIYSPGADTLAFAEGGVEAMRIDSSGRLLVGTSTAREVGLIGPSEAPLQIETPNANICGINLIQNRTDGYGANLRFGKTRGATVGSTTLVANGDELGTIQFCGADGADLTSVGAQIRAEVDGTPGNNDLPGRLVFSTTLDGASSPTERMRISNSGTVTVGKTAPGIATVGISLSADGEAAFTRLNNDVVNINRLTSDGSMVRFFQDSTVEGDISVSGTTISYNGGHLSRWSQLPGGATREEILRGTVLSNLDEMCGWGEEDNEQLNRMKVSDVEGDKNVSGVFQAWDDDDDTYTDDFYCAMTGDFIIRIAEGTTVQRGDLLMSAGDGTAKPQDDDIIRSKTIAKITCTHVTCTYEDGSYCVPCVLMAC